jgi:hypothetical protein
MHSVERTDAGRLQHDTGTGAEPLGTASKPLAGRHHESATPWTRLPERACAAAAAVTLTFSNYIPVVYLSDGFHSRLILAFYPFPPFAFPFPAFLGHLESELLASPHAALADTQVSSTVFHLTSTADIDFMLVRLVIGIDSCTSYSYQRLL